MNRLYTVVDKMPFAGKFAVNESVKGYIKATPETEKKKFTRAAALLGVFVAAHAAQAYMGQETLATHMNQLAETGRVSDALMGGLDFAYMTANAAVTMRQASLLKRTNDIRRRKNRKNHNGTPAPGPSETVAEVEDTAEATQSQLDENLENPRDVKKSRKSRAVMAAVAFTLTGQALFGASYIEADIEENGIECRTQTTQNLQEYEEIHGDVFTPEDENHILNTC